MTEHGKLSSPIVPEKPDHRMQHLHGQQAHDENLNGEFCLRWNNYQTNLTNVFDQLLQNESFVDVTLVCDGHSIKLHKIILSACSSYFQGLLYDNPCQHPIIIMHDVKWSELKVIVEFMYKGEINVSQDQIAPILRVADMLKIRGLADVVDDQELNVTLKSQRPHVLRSDATETNDGHIMEMPPVVKSGDCKNNARRDANKSNQDANNRADTASISNAVEQRSNGAKYRKRRCPSTETDNAMMMGSANLLQSLATPMSPSFSVLQSFLLGQTDDMEIKPEIAEMILEEEKVSKPKRFWFSLLTSFAFVMQYDYFEACVDILFD